QNEKSKMGKVDNEKSKVAKIDSPNYKSGSRSEQKSVQQKSVVAVEMPDIKTDKVKKEDKKLSVDPEEGQFLEKGGRQDFMLVNTMDTAIAVKIKCSNNALYRVTPVYLSIATNQITTLMVTRLPGPAKNDKLVAAYCPMEPGIKDPKEAMAKYEAKGKKCEIIRIMLKLVNAEDLVVPDPSREAVS
ncbi:hypothetical protein PMAYCL1PPCAC_28209, partial [Pristionchus mayeri]